MIAIEEYTDIHCPKCGYQIDDDDGENFGDYAGIFSCGGCGTNFEFVKNFKYNKHNPYTDIEWVSSILVERSPSE